MMAVVLVFGTALVGCRRGPGLVGKWKAAGSGFQPMQTLEFTPEGRLNMRGMGGVYSTWYKLQGDKLTTGRLTGPTDDTGSWSIKAGQDNWRSGQKQVAWRRAGDFRGRKMGTVIVAVQRPCRDGAGAGTCGARRRAAALLRAT
jgi:hypothetical protein